MRALEGAIPRCGRVRIITDVMAPNFRQNNYYQGISQALDKVFTLIEDAKLPAPQKNVQKPIFFTTRRKPFGTNLGCRAFHRVCDYDDAARTDGP